MHCYIFFLGIYSQGAHGQKLFSAITQPNSKVKDHTFVKIIFFQVKKREQRATNQTSSNSVVYLISLLYLISWIPFNIGEW